MIEDDQPLPRKPPNAWQNKVVIVIDPVNFSKLPGKPKDTKEKVQKKETMSLNEVEKKLKGEIMNKQMEEKIDRLEKGCQDLRKSLALTMDTINRMVAIMEKSEEMNWEKSERMEEIPRKNAEAQTIWYRRPNPKERQEKS